MVDDPTARAMVGYLLVRGGVHIVAYAKALEKLSGVDVGKLLPIPDISNKRFPEARKYEEQGASPHPVSLQPGRLPAGRPDLERPAPGGQPAPRRRGRPAAKVARPPDLPAEPQLGAPTANVDPGFLQDMARRLFGSSRLRVAQRVAPPRPRPSQQAWLCRAATLSALPVRHHRSKLGRRGRARSPLGVDPGLPAVAAEPAGRTPLVGAPSPTVPGSSAASAPAFTADDGDDKPVTPARLPACLRAGHRRGRRRKDGGERRMTALPEPRSPAPGPPSFAGAAAPLPEA